MRCKFCQAEYEENYNRCPNCGMREEYDAEVAARPDMPETRKKIWHNPFYWFWHSLKRYCSGKGRARRTEYFFFMFFAFSLWVGVPYMLLAQGASEETLKTSTSLSALLSAGSRPSDAVLNFIAASVVGAILFIPPMISLMIRRLHDIGLSGWYFVTLCAIQWTLRTLDLEMFTSILPLCLLLWPGTRADNAFGANPRYVDTDAVVKSK